MDKNVLNQWLKAGYMEEKKLFVTEEGTPQGGVASATLANVVLDGLERLIQSLAKKKDKINFIRYADDFICTADSKEVLEARMKPAIINFLNERELELSLEKTKITHIDEGFDFLGFNIRKYDNKLLIKPGNASINKTKEGVKETVQKLVNAQTAKLISCLNSKIRGWANYYRSCVAKKIFSDIDTYVFETLWRALEKKHPQKSATWIRKKYFVKIGTRNWCFSCLDKSKGEIKLRTLIKAADTKIRRHVKIKSDANIFDKNFEKYFVLRKLRQGNERSCNRIINTGLLRA